MPDCDHAGTSHFYVRFTKPNNTTHYAVKCSECKKLVRTNQHGGKLLIKHSDIPTGQVIHDHKEVAL